MYRDCKDLGFWDCVARFIGLFYGLRTCGGCKVFGVDVTRLLYEQTHTKAARVFELTSLPYLVDLG